MNSEAETIGNLHLLYINIRPGIPLISLTKVCKATVSLDFLACAHSAQGQELFLAE